jgi:hypothetical protein
LGKEVGDGGGPAALLARGEGSTRVGHDGGGEVVGDGGEVMSGAAGGTDSPLAVR